MNSIALYRKRQVSGAQKGTTGLIVPCLSRNTSKSVHTQRCTYLGTRSVLAVSRVAGVA